MDVGKRLERRVKRAVFGRVAGGGSPATARAHVDLGNVRRVLLVRSNFRMGNLLLVTPALAAIRSALPWARIDLVCARAYASLLAHDPDVDDVLGVDRHMFLRPGSSWQLVRHLRRQQYDLVIDCARGASFLGAALCAVSGGRQRVASAGSRYQRCFDVLVPRDGASPNTVDLLLAFVAAMGIPPVRRTMRVVLTEDEEGLAAARWHAWGLTRHAPVVGVSVGGRGAKRWPADRFVALLDILVRELDVRVVLFAAPEDPESLAAIRGRLPHGVVVSPTVGVRDFAALLARCHVVVTPDSGPMHLAAAVGAATVTIVQTPAGEFYRPIGERHDQIRAGAGDEVRAVVAAVTARLAAPPLPAYG